MQRKMRKFILSLVVIISVALALGMTSCKAWRTVTTTATYTEVQDSTKLTTTIQTKTQEEYTGKRKQ